MKYVVIEVKHGDDVREFPIIFPNILVHSVVAGSVIAGMQRYHDKEATYKAVSAGEISSMTLGERGACHGESETLKLKSRGDTDAALIKMHDYCHGII